mmetsp:Transcript_29058/g.47999  ORF Transcript_29058/g.47999 Transcript_29058/m.47999 type:complete len:660 (-) Transcript_29058:147-2126(-)|eukprot:CAMPEP_0119015978 /NCGR_PEP_ID=MMETSP1176-20130426/11750_1 /TAXON_ID=265551 /ORGANISM="Synedropsis recta cf, Strain CCMP1620" /LENGTH=659 /DNA_ID=CAMNT_0006969303 /DNA_START=151 /DNA_END=2130 /DNA_ORIENTATION=-
MGRNDDDDNSQEMGDKLQAPPDFDGPTSDRRCTDILCTLLIFAMWIAMTILGVQAIIGGDYRVILYPLDYEGNVCGTDFAQDMTDFPYFIYVNNYGGGVCVKECPSLNGVTADNLTDIKSLVTYGGLFQVENAEITTDVLQIGNYTGEDALFCNEEDCYPDPNDPSSSWDSKGVDKGNGFAYYVGDSYPVLSWCFLTIEASDRIDELVGANATLSSVEAGYDFWNDLFADLWTAREYIFGFGFGTALLVSFLYIAVLRLPALLNIVVWGSIFATITLFFGIGAYAFYLSDFWASEDPQIWSDQSITATKISSFVLFGIGFVLILLMICLRKQIQLAIGCVKETGKAVTHMPLIMFVPVIQGVAFILFVLVWSIYGIYLASQGEITVLELPVNANGLEVTVRTYEFDDYIYYGLWFLLFCFFWTSNFIVAYGDMVVAMSVAKWYFTRNKRETGNGTVIGALYDTGRYHLGTLAFGSLILALINLARAILAKVQKQVKKADSKIADCLLCCCQCCLWCFEQCIKFLNKNAYIQTAIFGTPFCTSAREAFFLILRNIGRIGAISYVSGAVLIIGKLFISSLTTGASYFLMSQLIGDELFSLWGPTVLVFLISYFIADMFLDVFEMGITTILQCFIADEEMFDGDQCFAEGDLQDWIDKYEEN